MALVGESGCGKTTLAATIAGALPEKTAEVSVGMFRMAGIEFGADTGLSHPMRRDARIAFISQDAMGSLDPCFSIGTQLSETYRLWHDVTRREARSRAVEYLDYVGLPDGPRLRKHFPHQLSGGMRQRVAIALSLMMDPTILVADEATTALDVTIQSEIVDLLLSIQEETGMAILFITHDLALAGEVADRIAVMYAARIVERGTAEEVMHEKAHPYTRALMGLIPMRSGRLTSADVYSRRSSTADGSLGQVPVRRAMRNGDGHMPEPTAGPHSFVRRADRRVPSLRRK